MQKLKNGILDKMIAARLTGKEIDFMLYISRFQDKHGVVYGIHYKEICQEMHMSYQGFYDVKESLERKGFIRSGKTNRIDHDITILDNVFLSEGDYKAGYINTNHNIFFSEEFYKLKAGAKLLAMKMMEITYAGKGCFVIGTKKFYDEQDGYPKRFGVSKRVMRSYLMSIKSLFSIGIKEGKYYIEPRKIIYKKTDAKEEVERLREHYMEAILRRNRIKEADMAEKKAVYGLLEQYGATAERMQKNLFALVGKAVEKSLELLNKGEKWIKKRVINIKLIHKLLRDELIGEGWTPTSRQASGAGMPGAAAMKEDRSEKVENESSQKGKAGNKFNHFHQRDYDYKELECFLLNTNPTPDY